MTRLRLALVIGLLASTAAGAQTADGSPTDPARSGLSGTPRPISRAAPGVGVRRPAAAAELPDGKGKPAPKPTAAELAEKRKLDRDLKICIGC